VVFTLSILLYIVGLLGDSYYGLVVRIPIFKSVYEIGFHIFSYTRNGIFYAPIILMMGVVVKSRRQFTLRISVFGFIVSMAFMLMEGLTLRHFAYPRHDSMYIALLPCMFFLFQILLAVKGKVSSSLREISLWIFVIHPLIIIGIRGVARLLSLTDLLVENSVVHYIVVCVISYLFAVFVVNIKGKIKPAPFQKGRAWIELDMESLRYNLEVLRSILPAGCELMPAVKANAYGHGATEICRELNSLGVRAFCVASVMEGVELRKRRITGVILVLGYTHPEQFPLLRRYRLTQTVIDYEYAQRLNKYGRELNVHLKIDTGMKRLGEPAHNIDNILRIFEFENLDITGIYTHFSARDDGFTQEQADVFASVLQKIEDNGFSLPKIHAQSSYGVVARPDLRYDYARVGLAIYGVYTGFRSVLTVKARVSAVKDVATGETVGYGSAFIASDDMRIAVLSIGYADGFPRSLSHGVGHVLINGVYSPVVGYVCMDQLIVDVTGVSDVKQGDVAVVIGRDGVNEITVFDVARQAGTVPNEVLSRLGGRLGRVS
jgi:serine/alanine racemase